MDSEERLELERELAAQLAALHEPDADEEDECAFVSQRSQDAVYVRLDLDQVLSECEPSADHEIAAISGSTWTLLLTNVQQCEADFFQPMKLELQELRDLILSSSIEKDRPLCPSSEPEATPAEDRKADDLAPKTSDISIITTRKQDDATVLRSTEEQDQSLGHALAISNAPVDTSTYDAANEPCAPIQSSCSTDAKEAATTAAPLCIDDPEILSSDSQDALNEVRAQQMRLIQVQLEERERWRQQIQEQQEREQEQAARWLQALELEMQLQDQAHLQRARERLEAVERRRMQHEEALVRLWLNREQEDRERELLAHEEHLSREFDKHLKQQERQQSLERSRMNQEEALVWRLLKLQQDQQHKLKLKEEKCTMRRLFIAALAELVQVHIVRLAQQKRTEDAARKRELRANANMRREELTQRRLTTQLQAVEDEQHRQRARTSMAFEDELSFTLRQLEIQRLGHERQQMTQEDDNGHRYRQNIQRELRLNRQAMDQEDSLARLYQAQIERLHIGISTVVRIREHILKRCLFEASIDRWQRVVQCEQRAVRCLQRFWRLQLTILQQQREGEADESDPTVIAAAMAVQSAFRGFSIRRKFANALAMAKLVGADDDDAALFENVDMDELIALPPELSDGWENPVLPVLMAARFHSPNRVQPHTSESSVHGEEDWNANDAEDQEEPQEVQREANFAASIWSRMRRAKRKTQAAAFERVKQQDPTYRVQKLLHRVSTKSFSSNQTAHSLNEDKQSVTVTWSTSRDSSKKRKKVKLPSLVDRLRKKTAAARDS